MRPLLLAACLIPAAPAAAAGYDAAFAGAAALERTGRHAEAAQALTALQPEYPEDYPLHLRLGWLWFSAGRWAEAEAAYSTAAEVSGGAIEARLGLAWTRLRQERWGEAADGFAAVLAEDPDNGPASEGLALATASPGTLVTGGVGFTFHSYQGHAVKDRAGGLTASLDVLLGGRWALGAAWRTTAFSVRRRGQSTLEDFRQHEAWLTAATGWDEAGGSLHYALLADSSGTLGTGHVAGLTLRWSPWGDLLLASAASRYDDGTWLQVQPSWRLPLGETLSLEPGVRLQLAEGEALAAARARLVWRRGRTALWLGGELGEQSRPVDWTLPAAFNVQDRIRAGAAAGISLGLGDHVGVGLSYDLRRYVLTGDSGDLESNAHFLTLGVSWTHGTYEP